MSSNLLAEFDTFYQQSQPGRESSAGHTLEHLSPANQSNPWLDDEGEKGLQKQSQLAVVANDDSDEDDWGEFETGAVPQRSLGDDNGFDEHNVWGEEATQHNSRVDNLPQYGATRELEEAEAAENRFTTAAEQIPNDTSRFDSDVAPNRPRRDSNVLFDVEDEMMEEDFGEFETAEEETFHNAEEVTNQSSRVSNSQPVLIDFDHEPDNVSFGERGNTTSAAHQGPNTDFFGSIENPDGPSGDTNDSWEFEIADTEQSSAGVGLDRAQHEISDHNYNQEDRIFDSDQPRKLIQQMENTTIGTKSPPPPDEDNFDAWEAFETPQVSKQEDAPETTTVEATNKSEQLPRPDFPQILQSPENAPSLPPANVPPPSLLLQLFPPIFHHFHTTISSVLPDQKEDDKTRREQLTHKSSHNFLISYLSIACVLAHIIAGCKVRWKRDTMLSQSMRIGPASAGKSSGMKLTGVDKGESAKEDREMADVVKAWRSQLGRLRSVVASAGLIAPIPEVSENLTARPATTSEAPVSAPKACALCGLKRNERVPKVDVDVHDDFGEYWHDHWGHKLCMHFWYSYKDKLPSR